MTKRRGAGEGSIFKRERPDGVWWVGQLDLGIRGGRRRYRTVWARTRKEAAERLTKMLGEQHTGTLPKAGQLTVGDYLVDWLRRREQDRVKPLRPSTLRSYAWLVNSYLIPQLGRQRLERLQPAHVEQALSRCAEAGLAPRSVHHARAVLRAAISRAERDGLVPRNVVKLTDEPTVPDGQVTSLTESEAAQFLASIAGDRLEALYRVALAMGLRRGEALGLRWEDVDLDGRELHVVKALQRVGGKLILVEPKTKKSRRTISLPGAALDALRAHKARQREDQLLAGAKWRNDLNLVFTTTIGSPLDGAMVTAAFTRALERAGVRHVRFHDLRHSCASLLMAQGVPPRAVMEVLGHSTITLTLNTYSHVLPKLRSESATAMDRALGHLD